VLDLACGTGAIAKELSKIIRPPGLIVGIDFAGGPLGIARLENPCCNFAEMDAEYIGLKAKFDVVICQYALMFFPEPGKVLSNLTTLLKRGGRLALAVHGTPEGVPYFSTIMGPVLRHIPDIRPAGTPNAHSFGRKEDLERVMSLAGFSDIIVKKFVFEYRAGLFGEYWSDYMSSTAHSIKSKIETKGPQIVEEIRREAEERSKKYTDVDVIVFPWDVLIATAVNR
jgi:ubiquinone/menaquinone biosynthesis C-methylase UbiE